MAAKITAVTIAKDVLKWLERPKKLSPIIPKTENGYIVIPDSIGSREPLDIQGHVKSKKQCEVCGIGGLAVALAFRIDNLSTSCDNNQRRDSSAGCYQPIQTCERTSLVRFLAPYFNRDNLLQVEDAFEEGWGLKARARDGSATTRLKAICRNIVDNKGEFVPEYK